MSREFQWNSKRMSRTRIDASIDNPYINGTLCLWASDKRCVSLDVTQLPTVLGNCWIAGL